MFNQATGKTTGSVAKSLQLEVLLEVHNEEELEHMCDEVDMVGVNNRNLKTFEVDIHTSLDLINKMPQNKLRCRKWYQQCGYNCNFTPCWL